MISVNIYHCSLLIDFWGCEVFWCLVTCRLWKQKGKLPQGFMGLKKALFLLLKWGTGRRGEKTRVVLHQKSFFPFPSLLLSLCSSSWWTEETFFGWHSWDEWQIFHEILSVFRLKCSLSFNGSLFCKHNPTCRTNIYSIFWSTVQCVGNLTVIQYILCWVFTSAHLRLRFNSKWSIFDPFLETAFF